MIYEYALEPELVATWTDRRDARYFAESFGLGQPRLVSHFPKRWKQLVWDAFHQNTSGTNDIERTRMEVLIAQLSETMVRREGSSWDQNRTWLENAEKEHDRKNFQAILARLNPRTRGEVLPGESFQEHNPRWKVARGLPVPRHAREMAGAMNSLLRCCRAVIFIDPYFGPEKSRYRRPLEAFLDALLYGRSTAEIQRVEVHTNTTSEAVFFKITCEKELRKLIPAGLRVEFKRWDPRVGGEVLHNRYILTDLGGVIFSHGLDQGETGETDDVSLMDRSQYELRWRQYLGDAPAFDLAEAPVVIVGTKSLRR